MAGRIGNYSDTRRYVSYQVGIETGNQSPWIGQGLGDADSIFIRKFRAVSPESMPILPHNQFIYVYGLLGLVGLMLLLFVCLSPIIQYPPLKNPLFFSFQLIAISSFMTETTLETQVGLSFYLTFNLLFIQSLLSVNKNRTMA
jgi:O-antigen ligase